MERMDRYMSSKNSRPAGRRRGRGGTTTVILCPACSRRTPGAASAVCCMLLVKLPYLPNSAHSTFAREPAQRSTALRGTAPT